MSDPSVLMIGWEYPPHNSGGLGVACEGLTQALAANHTRVYFTLPYRHSQPLEHVHLIECYDPSWGETDDQPPFFAYSGVPKTRNATGLPMDVEGLRALPTSQLEQRVHDYAQLVQTEAKKLKDVNVVHAHDWMTFEAATRVKHDKGLPFVAHIHSTEFDRIPSGTGSPYIHQTEYLGLQQADRIIAVSHYTKKLLSEKYAIPKEKIEVVHNGTPTVISAPIHSAVKPFAGKRPVVVFMGRLTSQKGAEYFIQLARQVLSQQPETLFVIAGHGDMYQQLLLTTANQRLSASVLFSGFLRGKQRELLLDRADAFVMPSLSEPFGLVAVEAAQRQTPVIISKTSGVSEVLPSAIVVDFWDVHQMSQTLLQLLTDEKLREQQVQYQLADLQDVTWDKAAQQVHSVYDLATQSPVSAPTRQSANTNPVVS